MNILVCPDKFKGSLTAHQVCNAINNAIREVMPKAQVRLTPLADGGEGTCALLTEWHGGHTQAVPVHGPLFGEIIAHYGISGDGQSAYIEMAEASGLTLLKPGERNPLHTTSLGTGELIADALDRGVNLIILGIGGSATNDAGIGMASALGYTFHDADGNTLKPTGENLIRIHSIRRDNLHPRLGAVEVIALCDVTNPLYGPNGAAYVYGPQKGADEESVEALDKGLRNFHHVVTEQLARSADFPGAGAAGGLGAGARIFLNASVQPGVNYIIRDSGLIKLIEQADMVITGEGKVDTQTFSGKVVSEVIRISVEAGKPVYVICGICELPAGEILARGVTKVISLVDEDTSVESAMKQTRKLIRRRIYDAFNGKFQIGYH